MRKSKKDQLNDLLVNNGVIKCKKIPWIDKEDLRP